MCHYHKIQTRVIYKKYATVKLSVGEQLRAESSFKQSRKRVAVVIRTSAKTETIRGVGNHAKE